MSAQQNYQPTHLDIHDWQCELHYLLRKPAKREPDRRRIRALRQLIAQYAVA
jgi:hypothetical protein